LDCVRLGLIVTLDLGDGFGLEMGLVAIKNSIT
jgi:hypothetical protein